LKKISHRGNVFGKSELENEPSYILSALNQGFDVEIDVWMANDKLWLGHDYPTYPCTLEFLNDNQDRLWIHCKNIEALSFLLSYKDLNIFWHQNDDHTLTSKGYIWTYPGKPITNNSVIVDLDLEHSLENAFGVCSDRVGLLNV
jgi:hypothetical protein